MSRNGKKPIALPKDVKVQCKDGAVLVEGPKGKLSLDILQPIEVNVEKEQVVVNSPNEEAVNKMKHGTVRSMIFNMVKGVTEGHKKDLEIQGIGFRAQLQGKKIVFSLGFSHPVNYTVPEEVEMTVSKNNVISISGIDRAVVGQVAAEIRAYKKPEPYQGKGIRYVGEKVRRKQGKKVAGAA